MPMLEANGLRFHVLDEGSGMPVLLLHGFPDTADLWRPQIDSLTARGFRTIAPDLRGRGRSDMPDGVAAYALGAIVQDVVGILDALGVERAHVVGHDWGAVVAWSLAAARPDRVDRLVAISVGCPGAAGLPTLEALQKGWYRLLIQFEGVAEELFQRHDWYLFRELFQGSGEQVDRYIAELSRPGALTAGFNWYRANLPPERLLGRGGSSRIPVIPAPTLGIFGARDLYLTEPAMLASARCVTGGWHYERFDDSGHWLMLEEPERFNRLLLAFLQGNS